MKRKMSENSLKNLEKGKPFSADCKEIAREAQKKSTEARKQNKTFRDACKFVLDNNQEIALSDLAAELANASAETKIKILQFLADYSGQKPTDKQEVIANVKAAYKLDTNVLKKAIDDIDNLANDE